MPITKQAIKKLRRDQSVETHNAKIRSGIRDAVKAMRRHPTVKALSLAFTQLDKAAKTHIVHKNKVSRLKSRLSRLLKKS